MVSYEFLKMNFKHLFISTLLLCAIGTIKAVEDEDFDGVTVEEEVEVPVADVLYDSPVPSDKKSVYLAEHFDDAQKFEKKWIKSQAKKEGISEDISKYDGLWKLEAPIKDGLPGDLGLVLKSKAKHAAISAKLDRPFVFTNKPLIVQYEVSLQDGQECGGAYLKLLSEGQETKDLKLFHDKTPYTIMFGPDKCGNDHKLHFIFKHRNPKNGTLEEKHCRKPKDRLEDYFRDKIPHLYTLILQPDNSFELWVDKKIINSGSLLEDFTPAVNPPAEIDDPNDKKPEDWDEREKIPDPEANKPEDWDETAPPQIVDKLAAKPEGWLDDEEPMIADPEALQPEDWDAEMDGEWEAPLIDNPKCAAADGCGKWEAPMIANPEYKGKWRAPLIDNPNYKGKWKPKRIPNPDFFEDLHPFKMQSISAVGFELWSMSQDILFDNIIITDELTVARKWSSDSFDVKRKKIATDAESLWGRAMKAMNYKPGWWAIYFVYCLIPLAIYVWYLRKRVKEESFVTRMISYAVEQPWLWMVYILVLGLPFVLALYFCCNFGSRTQDRDVPEREEYDAATIKKTDAVTKDDEPVEEDRGEGEEVEENEESDNEDAEEKDVKEEKENEKDESDEKDAPIHDGQGDVPRKRKVRKE